MENEDATICDNIFCLHNVAMSELCSWNKTRCSMYEIDPVTEDNGDGFSVINCQARLKYVRMGW
jgi:hypothetical protein